MGSVHLVDKDLAEILSKGFGLEFSDTGLVGTRAAASARIPPVETYARDDVVISTLEIPGLNGAPKIEIVTYRPVHAARPMPAFLHIHGGGFVCGTGQARGPLHVHTAATLGCLVATVNYRVAPETRAPGAIEDCYAALKWLHQSADALNVDRSRVAVGGESAGGSLACSLALMARDKAEFSICFLLLIAPCLDDRVVGQPIQNPYSGEFVFDRKAVNYTWGAFLGMTPGSSGVPLYSVPARANDLTGFPATYLSVGALDYFVDENLAFATRLLRAGVRTELHVFPGAYHGFDIVPRARVAERANGERLHVLGRAFQVG